MAAIASFVQLHQIARVQTDSLLDEWAVTTVNGILEKDTENLFLARMRAKVIAGQEESVLIARCYFKYSTTEGLVGPYELPSDAFSIKMSMDLLVSCYTRLKELNLNKSFRESVTEFKVAGGTPGATIEFHKVNEWRDGRSVDYFDIHLVMNTVEK